MTPPAGGGGLGIDASYLMARCHNGGQGGDGEIRGAEKGQTHNRSLAGAAADGNDGHSGQPVRRAPAS